MSLSPREILRWVESKGHIAFWNGAYNLNIIGVRAAPGTPNRFDVHIFCVYRRHSGGPFQIFCAPCTTDPGLYWLENGPRDGTAVMKPGQYRGAYQIGEHRDSEALVQTGAKVTVYRVDEKSRWPYPGADEESGYFGIQIHDAGKRSPSEVDKWSAGCQVLRHRSDMRELVRLCSISQDRYGPFFTYTLMDSHSAI